jgi:hypothetical protein
MYAKEAPTFSKEQPFYNDLFPVGNQGISSLFLSLSSTQTTISLANKRQLYGNPSA